MQSQTDKLYQVMKDGRAYRSDALVEMVYGSSHLGLSRLGARVFDMKHKYGVKIKGWKDDEVQSLYWYQIEREFKQEAMF